MKVGFKSISWLKRTIIDVTFPVESKIVVVVVEECVVVKMSISYLRGQECQLCLE